MAGIAKPISFACWNSYNCIIRSRTEYFEAQSRYLEDVVASDNTGLAGENAGSDQRMLVLSLGPTAYSWTPIVMADLESGDYGDR